MNSISRSARPNSWHYSAINTYNEAKSKFLGLLEAALYEPEKLKEIVLGNKKILAAKNSIGDNALHYLALETKLEEVHMLRTIGSDLPPYSILETLIIGYFNMVALLLKLGGDSGVRSISATLKSKDFPQNKKYQLRGLF